ncbi:hypothetical protein C7B19_26865 [Escherichia coli]|nr:hypothetical protein C7B19_26865 [Escherichia coli]
MRRLPMFSLALLKVRNTKPRLLPTNGVFTFIHLRFASSQDFVLSARVGQRHFSEKYSAYWGGVDAITAPL